MGTLQAQFQMEGDALARAEQQKSYIQMMMSQTAAVLDVDESDSKVLNSGGPDGKAPVMASAAAAKPTLLGVLKTRLTALRERYSKTHPEIRKLKAQIADEEAKEAKDAPVAQTQPEAPKEAPKETVAANEPKPAPPSDKRTVAPAAAN